MEIMVMTFAAPESWGKLLRSQMADLRADETHLYFPSYSSKVRYENTRRSCVLASLNSLLCN